MEIHSITEESTNELPLKRLS